MGVSVTPAWNGADSMDGDRSLARVTLRLFLEGREVSLQKDFPKVLAAPALGQRVAGAVPPLHRGVGPVEGHPLLVGAGGRFWRQPLWRCFSCCCWEEVTVAAQLSDYTVDHPNPAGSGLALLVGFGAGATVGGPCLGPVPACAAGRFPPPCLGGPLPIGPVGAAPSQICGLGGMSPTGTAGSVPTPCSPWGRARTFFPAVTRQKHFAPGDILTVYKSPKGRFSLEPEPLDYLLVPFTLLPVLFVGLFALCLLVTAAFLLGTGVAGLAASL